MHRNSDNALGVGIHECEHVRLNYHADFSSIVDLTSQDCAPRFLGSQTDLGTHPKVAEFAMSALRRPAT